MAAVTPYSKMPTRFDTYATQNTPAAGTDKAGAMTAAKLTPSSNRDVSAGLAADPSAKTSPPVLYEKTEMRTRGGEIASERVNVGREQLKKIEDAAARFITAQENYDTATAMTTPVLSAQRIDVATIHAKSVAQTDLYSAILSVIPNFGSGPTISDLRLQQIKTVCVRRIYQNEGGPLQKGHPKAVEVAKAFDALRRDVMKIKLQSALTRPNELNEALANAAVWVCPDEILAAKINLSGAEDIRPEFEQRFAFARSLVAGDRDVENQLIISVNKRLSDLGVNSTTNAF